MKKFKIYDKWVYLDKVLHIRTQPIDYNSLDNNQSLDLLFKIMKQTLSPFDIFNDLVNKNLMCIKILEDGYINFKTPTFKLPVKYGQSILFLDKVEYTTDINTDIVYLKYQEKDKDVY